MLKLKKKYIKVWATDAGVLLIFTMVLVWLLCLGVHCIFAAFCFLLVYLFDVILAGRWLR